MKHSSSDVIILPAGVNGFYDDKDEARRLRQQRILPMCEHGDHVVLDFSRITYSTQSFVHALLGEVLKRHGERALDRIEFKNCSPQIKSVVELVVDYSLGGFQAQATVGAQQVTEEAQPILKKSVESVLSPRKKRTS